MSADWEPIVNESFLRSYGLDAFVRKPFDAPEVVRLLRALAASPHVPPLVLPPRP
jgi:hypothetical protein